MPWALSTLLILAQFVRLQGICSWPHRLWAPWGAHYTPSRGRGSTSLLLYTCLLLAPKVLHSWPTSFLQHSTLPEQASTGVHLCCPLLPVMRRGHGELCRHEALDAVALSHKVLCSGPGISRLHTCSWNVSQPVSLWANPGDFTDKDASINTASFIAHWLT